VRYLVSQRKKKRSEPYSTGEVNSLIDSLIHPLYKKSEGYRVLDGLARALGPLNRVLNSVLNIIEKIMTTLTSKNKTEN
jgi:hypothetical protein